MATAFQSRLAPQLKNHERRIQWVVRGQLLRGGREFRARMLHERMSGPPGVFKKTGRLRRSLIYKTFPEGDSFILRSQIGGSIAPYAVEHEERGRLAAKRIFAEKAQEIMDSIRATMEFVGRDIGIPPGSLDRFVPAEFDAPDATSRAREAANTAARFSSTTSTGRRNLEQSQASMRRAVSSLKRKFTSFGAGGAGPTGQARQELLSEFGATVDRKRTHAAYRRRFAKLRKVQESGTFR